MKLLINTASCFKGGSLQVARSFLEECKRFDEHEFHVVLGPSLVGVVDKDDFSDNFFFYSIGYRPATRVFSLKSASSFLKDIEQRVNPDVVFTTSGPAYWRPTSPHLIGFNLAHNVYPDSPFWSKLTLTKRMLWKWKIAIIRHYFMRDADSYVVQTDDINTRLRHFVKSEKVVTVSNTCSRIYLQPITTPDKLPSKEQGEFRLLTLSAWYTHKNLDVIPAVIEALPEEIRQRIRFVLSLPEVDFNANFSQEHRSCIINVGPVEMEDGPALYRECDALFLPTLLECFSASYSESMAMNRPILTSDLGFARTVCGDAALYFNPMSPRDIADKICNIIESQTLRHELVSRGKRKLVSFSSARDRAERYLGICEDIAIKRKMKLLVNTASVYKGGSVQVAKSFLEECRKHCEHEFHVVLGPSLVGVIDKTKFSDNFFFYSIGYRPATRVFSLKSASSFLKEIEAMVKPNIVFTTSGPSYWRPDSPHLMGYNLPHYIYDDSPFWGVASVLKRLKWWAKGIFIKSFFTRDADAYVVQTDDINRRLRGFLKTDNVLTVSNTCGSQYLSEVVKKKLLPKKEPHEFRLLALSAWYPHKHFDVIPSVVAALPTDIRQRVSFILTLPDFDYDAHFSIDDRECIVNIGAVKMEDGPSLYQECDALFLPTLLECFSASYSEAMATKRPILTSDLSFSHAVCDNAALYFDPMSPSDIAEKIVTLVKSDALQKDLVKKGCSRLSQFCSASERAERYLNICDTMKTKV